jgi:FtsH-binding integral membrane protein
LHPLLLAGLPAHARLTPERTYIGCVSGCRIASEPRAVLNLRFCGAAVLAWGLIVWFARDFRDWEAVRGVLIASVVGLAVDIVINVWGTVQGWLNANAWGSTVVLVLLLLGGAYQLSIGARKTA